jgi:hypothetical protein
MKENEMGRICSTHGNEKKNSYRILEGKPEGKRPIGRPRRLWKYNIKIDGVVWTHLMWLRIGTSGGPLRTR